VTDLIAEIGSSPAPNWDFERWCAAAHLSGATHVKAQMFRAEHFPPGEQDSKKPLEFPRERLSEFVEAAHRHGLKAGVSVFDREAVNLAAGACDFIKLAAREQTNYTLAEWAVSTGLPVYRSMSVLTLNYAGVPMYVIQSYPAGVVRSIIAVFRAYGFFGRHSLRWGWSSHTRGTLDCLLAVRLGACVIEKHLCLDASDAEAGHSLLPHEFRRMARAIGTDV
jgi:sialic acid synthase SpsE